MMSPHDLNSNVTYLVFGDEAYANLTQPNLMLCLNSLTRGHCPPDGEAWKVPSQKAGVRSFVQ